MGLLVSLPQLDTLSIENGLQFYDHTVTNLPTFPAHTNTHQQSPEYVSDKTKVKHEYRSWQANYQMYSSFCIHTSEGKQMWESCRFHSRRCNDMTQQQKAQPSPGIEVDRAVNLLMSVSFYLVGFHISSFRGCNVVMGCLSESWNVFDFCQLGIGFLTTDALSALIVVCKLFCRNIYIYIYIYIYTYVCVCMWRERDRCIHGSQNHFIHVG